MAVSDSEREFMEQWDKDEALVAKRIFEWLVEHYEAYRNGKVAIMDTETWLNGMYAQGLTRLPSDLWMLMQVDDDLKRRIAHDHWQDVTMVWEVWTTASFAAIERFKSIYEPDYNKY